MFSPLRLPCRTSPDLIFKKGPGPLVEVPLSAMFLPYVGTTMRIFPGITSVQRRVFNWEARTTGKPIVFDIHPNEFIDESGETGGQYISQSVRLSGNKAEDVLRSRLKIRNPGPKAAPLYEKEIRFYQERGYWFGTVRGYCEKVGLLG